MGKQLQGEKEYLCLRCGKRIKRKDKYKHLCIPKNK